MPQHIRYTMCLIAKCNFKYLNLAMSSVLSVYMATITNTFWIQLVGQFVVHHDLLFHKQTYFCNIITELLNSDIIVTILDKSISYAICPSVGWYGYLRHKCINCLEFCIT